MARHLGECRTVRPSEQLRNHIPRDSLVLPLILPDVVGRDLELRPLLPRGFGVGLGRLRIARRSDVRSRGAALRWMRTSAPSCGNARAGLRERLYMRAA